MSRLDYGQTVCAAALLGKYGAQAFQLRDELGAAEPSRLLVLLSKVSDLALRYRDVLPSSMRPGTVPDADVGSVEPAVTQCRHLLRELSEISSIALTEMDDEEGLLAAIRRVKHLAERLSATAAAGARLAYDPSGKAVS